MKKYNNEQFKRLFRLFWTAVMILANVAVFAPVWLNYYNDLIVLPFVNRGHLYIHLLFALFLVTFLHSFDGLKFGRYLKTKIIISQVLAELFATGIMYLVIVLLAAKVVTPAPLLAVVAINALVNMFLSVLGDLWFTSIFPAKRILLIYDHYSPDVFIGKLNTRKDKFVLTKTMKLPESLDGFEKQLADVDGVILYDINAEPRNKLLKICFENNIMTYSTQKISDVLVRGAECLHLFDTPILFYRNCGITIEQMFVKRLMDIAVSLLMLIVFSPVMLLTALAIKLSDKGPVFFRQERATLNGKTFFIHKFRTMIVNAEEDGVPVPATENDPRITPLGSFLRKSRLDELPQLIDILVGNMSLVGPRPERIEHVMQYSEEIPEFVYRLKVKGGLTGYAQIYGKYNTSPYDKLQLDLMYIQNYSLLLDLKLLLMTVKIIFSKESTDGFTEEESKNISNNNKNKQ